MRRILLLLSLALSMAGCQSPADSPLAEEPTLAYHTASLDLLKSLPPPTAKLTVAVYNFRDQTGQYKPSETVTEYSRAVTQGGAEILVGALKDCDQWFTVVEREYLNELMSERKIIRETRDNYPLPDGKKLPPLGPLTYAGILLEGGIIGFDSDTLTGGLGARYLGIGGDVQYRRDTVSVFLRAVSVKTGEVLKSINTEKTIYSTQVTFGVFKYVSYKELLEIDAGFTVNEPNQLAVRQAIEKAVYALVMEGVLGRNWSFADPKAAQPLVDKYLVERSGVFKVSPTPPG